MNVVQYRSDSRGSADYGWLKTRYTFSFANYYCPSRINFGVLRVLNDDIVEPKMGFGTHPHDNMEIITIIHEGALEHKDSMGNGSVIQKGEVQVMSAGSGITHSEFNPSDDKQVSLFQIWIFPNKKNIQPRYDQSFYSEDDLNNQWKLIVSPDGNENSMWIQQDAWLYLGNFDSNKSIEYQLKNPDNGVFLMVIDGEVKTGDNELFSKDAVGLTAIENSLTIETSKQSKLLLIEVPMLK
ncbi:pirin family protein [Sunxiuqinia sp. A32]|uniref:pirin family protein n=1 Tax=Sunxiuqinia sp. A32 TaxID=3461496 RepID=UPI004045BAEB